MKPEPDRIAPDLDPDSGRTPLDWPRHTGRIDQVMEAIAVRQRRQRRRRWQAVIGATAALVVSALWFSVHWRPQPQISAPVVARTIISAPEQRTLPDGSIVELKPGAAIAVDFAGEYRRVALHKGEAHFQVAKNPARPFIVAAGGVEFRAVGTAFSVQLSATKVEMLVTEGRVAVDRPAAPASAAADATPLAIVDAGSQVAVDLGTGKVIAPPQPLSPVQLNENLAWRVPRLNLSDTPLSEVVAALNQHHSVPLELSDPALGRLAISGILRADNVEPLLRMLEDNYGIHAIHEHGKIVLRK